MNESDQANCHCMIKHPSAVKFLAIKHADGWSPPVALVIESRSLSNQAKSINQGLMENYGFMTAVLRQIASSPGYRCIEVDRLTDYGRGGMQAAWVGKKEYSEFRRSSPDQYDPIAAWLDEKEKGKASELRPAWEKKGWFTEARDWIQQSLKELGIHQKGPVEQFRAFRTSSSILRVPAAGGDVYFKACMQASPAETMLTAALAEQWPQFVEKPLKVDADRNWMLSRDYGDSKQAQVTYSDYPEIARNLAEIQMGSLDSIEKWQALGCPEVSLERLSEFAANLDQLSDLLVAGGGEMALTEAEVKALNGRSDNIQVSLKNLSTYAIPNMLVHPDLWFTNVHRKADGFAIEDWSGTAIAHPFFSLMKMLRFRSLERELHLKARGEPEHDNALIDSISSAYFEAFSGLEPPDRLAEALLLVQELGGLWRLFNWHQALAHEEKMSVSYQSVVRHIQRIARQMAAVA